MKKPVDRTLRYQMKYNDGRQLGKRAASMEQAYEESGLSAVRAGCIGQFAPYCGEDTKGIYVEAALSTRRSQGQFGRAESA